MVGNIILKDIKAHRTEVLKAVASILGYPPVNVQITDMDDHWVHGTSAEYLPFNMFAPVVGWGAANDKSIVQTEQYKEYVKDRIIKLLAAYYQSGGKQVHYRSCANAFQKLWNGCEFNSVEELQEVSNKRDLGSLVGKLSMAPPNQCNDLFIGNIFGRKDRSNEVIGVYVLQPPVEK